MDLNFTTWAGLTALAAGVAAGWNYVRAFAVKVMDLVICRVVVANGTAGAVMALCIKDGRRSPLSLRVFGGSDSYVHPVGQTQLVAYESISSDPLLFWFRGRPLVVSMHCNSKTTIGISGGGDGYGVFGPVQILCLRGTLNLDAIINEAVTKYNALKRPSKTRSNSRFHTRYFPSASRTSAERNHSADGENAASPQAVDPSSGSLEETLRMGALRLLQWKPEDLRWAPPAGRSAFADYPFPPVVGEALLELQQWLDNEKWFRSKGIPWRRGWLLHGKPGTGKSTMVRSIGQEYDLPVFIFDLASLDNAELRNSWRTMQGNSPCIALIEDIDAVFKGRENIVRVAQTRDALTFDCLLNCISGVGQNDGVFLIVTTNHVEHLDPALGVPHEDTSSRPGRLDRAIFLGDMGEAERRALASNILSDWPELITETVGAGDGETAAQFQYRCAQLALTKFWERQRTKEPVKALPVMAEWSAKWNAEAIESYLNNEP